jgi:hypothetical protein
MSLHINCEMVLRCTVEINHGVGELLGERLKFAELTEKSFVECAINLR